MTQEQRKIHLIEKLLKVNNDATLTQLEILLDLSGKEETAREKSPDIYDFVGMLSKEEAGEIKKAIEETSETIHPDDWK